MKNSLAKCPSDWWRSAVIYQIYPRSFVDSNSDGIGDLKGITQKLGYLSDLGVDAVWISPFFESPMKDFGYDISDYRRIDHLFGSMDDFDELIDTAHRLGLKIIIDQVYSHTSDQHQWFQESRQSSDNDKADWYVWANPNEDGSPPNNWLSIFGGSAWKWDSLRKQYYLHNFLESQPDLNFHNPAVRQAQLDNLRFWLDKGVDGVRLDVVNFYFHDLQLRSNPAVSKDSASMLNARPDNPYTYQDHLYDIDQAENLEYLESMRAVLNEYPGAMSIGEISSRCGLRRMAEYTCGDQRLHMAYTFELLSNNLSAGFVRDVIESSDNLVANGWPCWAIGNHDVERFYSRWGSVPGIDRVAFAVLFAMRGSLCFYQGDELSLPQAEVACSELQDPYGLNFRPMFAGRDGCRTPMIWDSNQPFAGFSDVQPWMSIPDEHMSLSVVDKLAESESSLNLLKSLICLRKESAELQQGQIKVPESDQSYILIERQYEQSVVAVAINFSTEQKLVDLPYSQAQLIELPSLAGELQGQQLMVEPMNAVFIQSR